MHEINEEVTYKEPSIYNTNYLTNVININNREITQNKIDALRRVLAYIDSVRGFFNRNSDDAKTRARREEKANRLRLELIEIYTKMGLSVQEYELMNKLKSLGKVRISRKEESYRKFIKSFEKELLEAGVSKDDLNKIYTPALKRYLKLKQNDPFNIGYSLY